VFFLIWTRVNLVKSGQEERVWLSWRRGQGTSSSVRQEGAGRRSSMATEEGIGIPYEGVLATTKKLLWSTHMHRNCGGWIPLAE
jgi:hypothetical protein